MKKILFGCAIAMCGLSAPTFAQDCCYPAQSDCCFETGSFDGLYIGGNVGAFTHTIHRNDLDGGLTDNSGWSRNNTNVTAGVLLGYDWQCNSSLFGIVADWNWVNTRHRLRNDPSAVADSGFRADNHWFTTIRARAGVTVCDALVYVTGGAAVTKIRNRWTDTTFGPDGFRFNDTRWGWTGGVGTEFLLGCNWSVGFELLFLHFDEKVNTATVDATTFSFGHSDSAWLGRLTLNYRLGDLCSCF